MGDLTKVIKSNKHLFSLLSDKRFSYDKSKRRRMQCSANSFTEYGSDASVLADGILSIPALKKIWKSIPRITNPYNTIVNANLPFIQQNRLTSEIMITPEGASIELLSASSRYDWLNLIFHFHDYRKFRYPSKFYIFMYFEGRVRTLSTGYSTIGRPKKEGICYINFKLFTDDMLRLSQFPFPLVYIAASGRSRKTKEPIWTSTSCRRMEDISDLWY